MKCLLVLCIWVMELGVCAFTFLLCDWFFVCVDREPIGPVQIATWVFVQYDEVNLYVMFSFTVFFFKCCMIFWLWTIFLLSHHLFLYVFEELGQFLIRALIKCTGHVLYVDLCVLFSYRLEFWLYCSPILFTSQTVPLVLPLFDFWCPPKILLQPRDMSVYVCWYWHPDMVFCSLYYLHWVWWGSALWKTDCLTGRHREEVKYGLNNTLAVFKEHSKLTKWKCRN